MVEQLCAQIGGKADAGLGGKELSRDGAGKTHGSHDKQQKEAPQDIRLVAFCNADIDHLRHHHRDKKIKYDL